MHHPSTSLRPREAECARNAQGPMPTANPPESPNTLGGIPPPKINTCEATPKALKPEANGTAGRSMPGYHHLPRSAHAQPDPPHYSRKSRSETVFAPRCTCNRYIPAN